jgi:hypothetical protein
MGKKPLDLRAVFISMATAGGSAPFGRRCLAALDD